ncbi:MAG: hypothetical protein EHM54_02475 [Nitrospiraceae bacterium]|nr:MAG: hypothetical protein EHM54_02475 [Nitrospiraceae bacterium]
MRKLLLSGATGKRQVRKSYEITRDSFVRIYPSIDDTGERDGFHVIASLMKRLVKGSASPR